MVGFGLAVSNERQDRSDHEAVGDGFDRQDQAPEFDPVAEAEVVEDGGAGEDEDRKEYCSTEGSKNDPAHDVLLTARFTEQRRYSGVSIVNSSR